MYEISRFLMRLSAAFYCVYDIFIKEQEFKHYNNQTNAVFKQECEIEECVGRYLKLFENGKLIEDGFLTVAAPSHDSNSTLIKEAKKILGPCVLEVNQELDAIPRCSKFQTGIKLLMHCVNRKTQQHVGAEISQVTLESPFDRLDSTIFFFS